MRNPSMRFLLGLLGAILTPLQAVALNPADLNPLSCLRQFTTYAAYSYTVSIDVGMAKDTKRRVVELLPRFGGRLYNDHPGIQRSNPSGQAHIYVSTEAAEALQYEIGQLGTLESRTFHQNYFSQDFECVSGVLDAAEQEQREHAASLARMPNAARFLDILIKNARAQRDVLGRSSGYAEIMVWMNSSPRPTAIPDLSSIPRDYFERPYVVPEAAWNYFVLLGVPDPGEALRQADAALSKFSVSRKDIERGQETYPVPFEFVRRSYRMPLSRGREIDPKVRALGRLIRADLGRASQPYLLNEINWRIGMLQKVVASGAAAIPGFSIDPAKAGVIVEDLKSSRSRYHDSLSQMTVTVEFLREDAK